ELLESRDQRVHQLVRERIQLLRPVHQHDADRAVALDDYERLCRNAWIASFASSFTIERASQSRACPIVSCHEMSRHQFSCCFVYRVVCGSLTARFSTTASTLASSSAAGTAQLTSPHSAACLAGISSHISRISRARRSPTKMGSHCVAPP